MWIAGIIIAIAVALALTFSGRGWLAWVVGLAILFATWVGYVRGTPDPLLTLLAIAVALALVTGWPPLRRLLFAAALMPVMGKVLPKMGDTERVALEAGTVWWDAQIFSGTPDWQYLLDFECRTLDEREQAFMDGPVDTLCRMLDDWAIEQRRDLAPEAWDFIKRERFFGMMIPPEYGGLGFSEIGHSRVVTRLASRSLAAAVTVMVPNSLGPAELLLAYGTEAQKTSTCHAWPMAAKSPVLP